MALIVYIITHSDIMEDIALLETENYFENMDLHWTSKQILNDWHANRKYKIIKISKDKFNALYGNIYTSYCTDDFMGIYPLEENSIHEKILLLDILDIK